MFIDVAKIHIKAGKGGDGAKRLVSNTPGILYALRIRQKAVVGKGLVSDDGAIVCVKQNQAQGCRADIHAQKKRRICHKPSQERKRKGGNQG